MKLTEKEIKSIFGEFKGKKIGVIGDVMLDSYFWGSVNRISPEAPVPVVWVNKSECRPGGAANVALNIKSLGATPYLFSVIGEDKEGKTLLETLNSYGIEKTNICTSNTRKTTNKTRVIGNNQQQLIRIDFEDEHLINDKESNELLKKILSSLKNLDAIIFEDYDKGVITEEIIRSVIIEAKKNGKPVIVDPKKRNFFHYKDSTLFKPNLRELNEALDIHLSAPVNIDQLNKAVAKLFKTLNISNAMITLSDEGIYIHDCQTAIWVKSHKRNIFDVSGAGDTVTAVAALSLCLGLNPELIAELSNVAGGLVCEKTGVVPIDFNEFLEETTRLLV